MSKIDVGIIGCGFIGKQHIEAIKRVPNLNIVAICDRDETQVKKLANVHSINRYYTNVNDFLKEDMLVVHNCTPNNMHYHINKLCLENKKHIFCEKPFTISSEEGNHLLKIAESNNKKCGVNFNYRHNSIVRGIRESVENMELGRIFSVHGNYFQDWLQFDTDFDWRINAEIGGATRAVSDIGSHIFDLSQFILNKKIVKVYAKLFTFHPIRKEAKKGNEVKDIFVSTDDSAFIMAEFEDGTPAIFHVSQTFSGKKNELSISLQGEKKSMSWNQERCDLLQIGNRDKPNETLYATATHGSTLPSGHSIGWADSLKNSIAAFYDNIFSTSNYSYVDIKEATYIVRLTEACLESNVKNMWINV